MKPLSETPTKQEELDHFASWVAGLPRESYLADLFADTITGVASHIETDGGRHYNFRLAWQRLTDANREAADACRRQLNSENAAKHAEKELAIAEKKLAEVQQQLEATESKLDRAQNTLIDLKEPAENFARQLRDLTTISVF